MGGACRTIFALPARRDAEPNKYPQSHPLEEPIMALPEVLPTTVNPAHRWACEDCAYTTDSLNLAREHAVLTRHVLGRPWMYRPNLDDAA